MLFSSNIFLFVFLPAVLLGYYLLRPSVQLKNYFLLAASLLFYAWGEPIYVFLMLSSIAGNYLFGLAVHGAKKPGWRKLWLALAVVFDLGILFWFKYMNFLVENINVLLGTSLAAPAPALPIGISFFTFQAMSYVIDVYRGTTEVQKNPFYLALYISFFPQLIAGPIVRYSTIAQQIRCRKETLEAFRSGVTRFILGFSKKVLLSNVLSLTAEEAFSLAAGREMTMLMAWMGAVSYTLQVYFDFSGYSDMAIGLGQMFGFQFEENFNYPYLSRSVSEFWRRWHISLGQWFRDYVYFPLGGSRKGKGKTLRNLCIVWLLTGIWHGADWNYILWGLFYGSAIIFEKYTAIPKRLSPAGARCYHVFSLLVVVSGFVLFGAADVGAALYQLGAMFGISEAGISDPRTLFLLGEYWHFYVLGMFFATPLWRKTADRLPKGAFYEIAKAAVCMGLLILGVSYLAMGAHNPFIYFNF